MKFLYQTSTLFIITFMLLQEKIKACPANCETCDDTEKICSKCNANFFLAEDNLSCITKCPVGKFGNKKTTVCVEACDDGFYGEPTKRTCDECPEKCALCQYYSGKVNCVKCSGTNKLNLPSMTCTEFCKDRIEWIDKEDTNATCRSCREMSSVPDCGFCDDKGTVCTGCPTAFYNISADNGKGNVLNCTSCTKIGGRLGCNKCSFRDQVVNCTACSDGYTLDAGGICIACGPNCASCSKQNCTTCKPNHFKLYPSYKNCSLCNEADQTKQTLPLGSESVCVYNPTPVVQLGRVRFDEYEKVQAAMYSNICEDKGYQGNNNYSVYYVCSLNEAIINSTTTLDIIKNNLQNNLEVSKPNYADTDSKFWGQSKNNTIVCPGKANGYYYLRYFCENFFQTRSGPSQTVKYRIPLSEGRQTQLLLVFDRNLTEVQREDLLCTLEDLFALKGKFLVRTPNSKFCQNQTTPGPSNLRQLANSNGNEYALAFIVDHDPYSPRESDVSEKVMDIMFSSFNKSMQTKYGSNPKYLGFESNQMYYSIDTTPVAPLFKSIRGKNISVVNDTEFTVRLTITNVDSVVHVGFNANYSFRQRPNNVDELKSSRDVRAVYSYLAKKGREKTLIFSGLEPGTNYSFYFGAEELTSGKASPLYVAYFITSNYLTALVGTTIFTILALVGLSILL